MKEHLKIILVIYGLIVAVGCWQFGPPFSLREIWLLRPFFAAGYSYGSRSSDVELQKHMIEIQKNGGEKDETLDEHDQPCVEYTSVADAKRLQQQYRNWAMADLRDSFNGECRVFFQETIYP